MGKFKIIKVEKYFKPHIENVGYTDYEFQEHLTDYLLGDIIEQNEQVVKYYDIIKEIKELCDNANKTGRKTYLTYDILDIIQKVKCK